MSDPAHFLGLYLHLARAAEMRRRPHARDRMLVLAGVVAVRAECAEIARRCREKVLDHNPNHLLKRWASLEAAVADDEFQPFLKKLQRQYPQERAEQMLDQLGIDMARERETYYSDEEYALSLLC